LNLPPVKFFLPRVKFLPSRKPHRSLRDRHPLPPVKFPLSKKLVKELIKNCTITKKRAKFHIKGTLSKQSLNGLMASESSVCKILLIKGPYQRDALFCDLLYILLVVVKWDEAMTRVVIFSQTPHHLLVTLLVTYHSPLSDSLSPLMLIGHTFLSISSSITVSNSLSHSLSFSLSNVVIYNTIMLFYVFNYHYPHYSHYSPYQSIQHIKPLLILH